MNKNYPHFKRFLLLVAVLLFSISDKSKAQYDVYANQLISNSTDINNPSRVVDADQTNYADINTLLGVLATSEIRVRFPEYGAAGDVVNFTVQGNTSLLSTSVLSGVTIKLYDSAGTVPVATGSGSSVLQLSLLGLLSSGSSIYNLKFVTNPGGSYKFKEARIELSSVLGVGLLSELRLYGAYFQRPCPPVYANGVTAGSTGLSLLGNVDSASNVVDANTNNSARMYAIADILGLGGSYIDVTFPKFGKAGDYVGFTVANTTGLLDLSLLSGLTIITYDESGSVRETKSGSSLLDLKLLSGTSDRYSAGFQTTPGSYRISKVRLLKSGVVGLLSTIRVFNGFYYTINRPPVSVSTSGPVKFCAGSSVVLTAFDSLGATNYTWSTGATTASITVSTAGSYYVSVTDSFACERRSIPIVVTVNPNPTPVIVGDSVLCSGTGSLTVTKTYPFHLWSTGSASASISGVKPGKYFVTVTDSNTCKGADTITVINNMLNVMPTITPATCSNASNGSISLTVTNGSGNYSYRWSTGSTASSITGQKEGLYTCIVKDNIYGCSFNKTFSLTSSNTLTTKTSVVNTSACGKTDGSVALSVIGGSGTYTYLWSNGATTANLTGVGANIYTVTITDGTSGCSKMDTVAIGDGGNTLVVTPTITNSTSCSTPNGAISVAVTGGSGTYTYKWSTGATTASVTGLTAGNYYVVVKDGSNNCAKAMMFTVNNNGALTANATIVKAGCNKQNGSITINSVSGGSGNYSYLWSTGATTAAITNLPSATYIVNITDITSGCFKQEFFTVTDSTGPTAILAVTQPDCNTNGNGAVTVTAAGTNNVYFWSNGFTTKNVTGLKPGTYTVTIYDTVTFCTSVYQAVLSVKNPIRLVAGPISNTGCATALNGGVNVTVTGGLAPFTYSWSSSETTKDITGKDAGTYNLTVTDANGCNNTISAVVVTDTAKLLNATVGTITQSTCNSATNGGVTVNVSGGKSPYAYLWTPGGATTKDLTNVLAGTYNLRVTDAAGCIKNLTAVIITDTSKAIKITAATITDAACSGNATGAISVNVTGGVAPFNYAWTGGKTTKDITNLVPGTYTLTATDAAGCFATFTAVIKVDTANLIKLTATSVVKAKCALSNSGAVTVGITGGKTPFLFMWSNGATTKDLSAVPSGTYNLTVTDANGCSASLSVAVGIDTTNSINTKIDSVRAVGCLSTVSGAVFTSTTGGTSPYTYTWSNGATTEDIINIATGNYTLVVRDAAGCSDVVSATVANAPLLVVNGTATDVNCNGGNDGKINVTVTSGSGSFSYSWSDGRTTGNRDSLMAGSYTVKVTDNRYGCFVNKTFTVAQADSLMIAGSAMKDSCLPGFDGSITVQVSGGTSPYTYSWTDNVSSSFTASMLAPKDYTVTVTDNKGCMAAATYTVSSANCDFTINIHDVITPNGDGKNDEMVIEGIEFYPNSLLQVVDKWGDLVYEKRNYDNSFRGVNSKSGAELPSGTYYYILQLNEQNKLGGENTFKGSLLIKR